MRSFFNLFININLLYSWLQKDRFRTELSFDSRVQKTKIFLNISYIKIIFKANMDVASISHCVIIVVFKTFSYSEIPQFIQKTRQIISESTSAIDLTFWHSCTIWQLAYILCERMLEMFIFLNRVSRSSIIKKHRAVAQKTLCVYF